MPICYLESRIVHKKLLTHLEDNELMPHEQKGCTSNSRATKDQLLIDKMILTDSRCRYKNLSMAWLDFQKAFSVHKQLCSFIQCTMSYWSMTLYVNNVSYGDIKIQHGVSPLVYHSFDTTVIFASF